jgi:hypothetical protein
MVKKQLKVVCKIKLISKGENVNEKKQMVKRKYVGVGYFYGRPAGLSSGGMDKREKAKRQGYYLQCGQFNHPLCEDGKGV